MKLIISSFLIGLIIFGCSASTDSRYSTKKETNKESAEEKEKIIEDFDITPYKTDITIEAAPIATDKIPPDVWYEYDDSSSAHEKIIIGTVDGYRVQVLSTDDIDQANLIRAEIYEKTTRMEVYIIFEPPFYKVKAGDFSSKNEAEDLRFKMNQLGYTESKVVQETVNLFK